MIELRRAERMRRGCMEERHGGDGKSGCAGGEEWVPE